jgi:hypothetical protein
MKARWQSEVALCAVAGWLATSGFAAASEIFPAEFGMVFPGSRALELVKQCRPVPKRVSGVWTPTTAQIRELEENITPAFLRARKIWMLQTFKQMGKPVPSKIDAPGKPYYRQYGGLVVDGRKIIYANAFFPHAGFGSGWRAHTISVCDGGAWYFGVEYNPEKKLFSNFEFGGTG